MNNRIDIGEDFTRYPGGRFITDGPYSGERFRNELLIPSLAEYKFIYINLNSALGCPCGFLEEAFGGLVRAGIITSLFEFQTRVHIDFNLKYTTDIHQYVQDECCRLLEGLS